MSRIEAFNDREALAAAAAAILLDALAAPDARSLVVTGGATPAATYDRLALADCGWSRITVTLSDERWVDPASADSNQRLVRDRLLVHRAAAARFLPLGGGHGSPDEAAVAIEPELRALTPFAAVLLGMGEDGHIASLFPQSPHLDRALDPDGDRLAIGVAMSGQAPFTPRLSLTLRALLATPVVVLLTAGDAKRALIERVGAMPAFVPPVASLLRQDRTPVRVLWAP
jgi:6-phosphogluconolactonase